MSGRRQLRFVIGPNHMDKDGFRVFLGDEEITDDLLVARLAVHPLEGRRPEPTLVTLDVYASVDVEGDTIERVVCMACDKKVKLLLAWESLVRWLPGRRKPRRGPNS